MKKAKEQTEALIQKRFTALLSDEMTADERLKHDLDALRLNARVSEETSSSEEDEEEGEEDEDEPEESAQKEAEESKPTNAGDGAALKQ